MAPQKEIRQLRRPILLPLARHLEEAARTPESVSQSIRQSVSQPVSQSVSCPTSQAVSQSVTQPVRQSGRQKHQVSFFGGGPHLRVMGSKLLVVWHCGAADRALRWVIDHPWINARVANAPPLLLPYSILQTRVRILQRTKILTPKLHPPPPPKAAPRYRGGGGSSKSKNSLGEHFVSQNDDFTRGRTSDTIP